MPTMSLMPSSRGGAALFAGLVAWYLAQTLHCSFLAAARIWGDALA